MDNYLTITERNFEMFKLQIIGGADSIINKIRYRFNNKNIFYRAKVVLKIRFKLLFILIFKCWKNERYSY